MRTKTFSLFIRFIVIIFTLFNFFQCTASEKVVGESVLGETNKPQSFKKIAPLTANSLGSRKNLHENGWYAIPSSKKSLDEAYETGQTSVKVARAMVLVHLKKRAQDYPGDLGDRMKKVYDWTKEGYGSSSDRTKDIYQFSSELSLEEWKLAKSSFNTAGSSLVYGYITLGEKLEEDSTKFSNDLTEVAKDREKKTKDLNQVFASTLSDNSKRIAGSWKTAYQKAMSGFAEEYEESGERNNSLLALWDIFQGYSVAVSELVVSPIGNTVAGSTEMMLVGGTYVPVSHTMNFSKDMLMTTGLVFYYGTKKGYRVISPTLEAGFFSSVGLLSASSTVPTYIGGTSLGAFNQITSVAAVTGSGVVGGVGSLGYETTATATGMFYDLASGSAESGVYLMSSGVILSYTAVTALPAQMAISVVEGPIFITYDGPRVVIAVAKGNFVGYDDYPTGSVINLEKEKKAGNIKILTDDPKIIKKVLDAEMEGQKAKANKGKSK